MKKLMKTLSALLVTAVATAALVVPVSADTKYAAITGNKVTFYKTLIVDKDAAIPNLVFTFKTTAGTAAKENQYVRPNNLVHALQQIY